MRPTISVIRVATGVAIATVALTGFAFARAQERQAVPRDGTEQGRSEPGERERRPPKSEPKTPPQRTPATEGDRRDAARRAAPPPHYYFRPVDVRVRFYYHPYFGFYYGPYYGPYYPGGRIVLPARFTTGAVRLKVKPVDAAVYVNGYYAGRVDDFDNVFQRLYLPGGEHEIALRLAGYEPFTMPIRVRRGDTLEIVHEMRRRPVGAGDVPPPAPRALPHEWTEPPADVGEEPVSPYGVLALRTEPSDARIIVNGEAWAAIPGQSEFVIHLPRGWHDVEVRRNGYQPFNMRVELTEGQTTRLDARLVPE